MPRKNTSSRSSKQEDPLGSAQFNREDAYAYVQAVEALGVPFASPSLPAAIWIPQWLPAGLLRRWSLLPNHAWEYLWPGLLGALPANRALQGPQPAQYELLQTDLFSLPANIRNAADELKGNDQLKVFQPVMEPFTALAVWLNNATVMQADCSDRVFTLTQLKVEVLQLPARVWVLWAASNPFANRDANVLFVHQLRRTGKIGIVTPS